jgi:hypothetical protein
METVKTTVKSVLFPVLLSLVVLISILNVYDAVGVGSVLAVFAANFALFVMYEKMRLFNKNWFSTLVIIVLFIVAIIAATQFVRGAGRENLPHLIDWFFKAGDTELYFPMFTAALLSFFTPFISSTVFYFTNVRYNPFYLMLTCMTTFAIYAKTLTDVPFIFPALIVASFLFIAVERRWYRGKAETALSYRKFVVTGLCFVVLSSYIAGLFPPAESTPYRRYFDEFLAQGRFSEPLGFANIIDANWSGGAGGSRANLEQIIFLADSNHEPRYLRRQVFDEWTGDRWRHSSDEANRRHTLRSEPLVNLTNYEADSDSEIDLKMSTIFITTTSAINFIPSFPNTYGIAYFNATPPIEATIRGEFRFNDDNEATSRRGTHYLLAHSDTPAGVSFTGITSTEYAAYVRSTLDLPNYYGRERVQALAYELTRDYDCTFERALAIKNHFYNGEFIYDLDFVPRSKCVYTFLFETQRGTCSDFATAMTIIAREAGIPTRYTEGYVLEERNSDGMFVVRLEHGHAFPEVFIEGTGWVIFEPTVPGGGGSGLAYTNVLFILASIGLFGIATVLFLLFALPKIREHRFRNQARNAPSDTKVRLIYERIYSSFMKSRNLQERTLSSRDIDRFANAEYGVRLNEITENYDRVVYGGVPATDGNFYETYCNFCDKVKLVTKQKRRGDSDSGADSDSAAAHKLPHEFQD